MNIRYPIYEGVYRILTFETYSLILKQLNNHYHAQYIQAFILHQP